MGAPLKWNRAETCATIFARIAEGRSLRNVCTDEDMPSLSCVMGWIADDTLLQEQYVRARAIREEHLFEDIVDEGKKARFAKDAVEVAGARLYTDNLKWVLGRMNAKKYGDRVQIDADLNVKKSAADLTDDELARIARAKTLAVDVGEADSASLAGP